MELFDRQNIRKLNKKKIQKYLKKIFACLLINKKSASFVFCDNSFICRLNKEYFGKNFPTDVIAFNLNDDLDASYLGEVIVSVEEAVLTAKEIQVDWQRELLLYLIHGVLHLIGFTDQNPESRKKMEEKQSEILASFVRVDLLG